MKVLHIVGCQNHGKTTLVCEIIEELVTGETVEPIDVSLSRAKELVSKVRLGVQNEISLAKVPAGAPERTSPDLSTLSPREKIQFAMGRK